jgi:RNA polymerase sigma-70 factor (ECF subfamily)
MTPTAAAHHPRMDAAPDPRLRAWLPDFVAWIVARDGELAPALPANPRADLVRTAATGDQQAFERLVRPAGDRLLAIARKILRDPDAAEDAVQVAVIQAWRELPRLREPDRFDAWLTKLLVNACYQEARRARRNTARVERVAAADAGGEAAAPDDAESLADRLLIERAFLTLSPAHRAIVVLHHYADLPLAEVAAIAGIAPGTARSRLHYALRALRAALEAADRPTIEEVTR